MTKKNFKDDLKQYASNPVSAFITPAQETKDNTSTSAMGQSQAEKILAMQSKRLERITRELENRRLQLVMTESLYTELADLARYDGKKVAQLIKDTLRKETSARQDEIEKIRSLYNG